jgi:hypothetical protein
MKQKAKDKMQSRAELYMYATLQRLSDKKQTVAPCDILDAYKAGYVKGRKVGKKK